MCDKLILGRAHSLGKAAPFAAGFSRRGRMPPAVKASVNRSPCVIIKLLYVPLLHVRRGARPWFFPLGFLVLFPSPPFPRLPRHLAAGQKVTAYETTMRGQNPSAQVLAPLEGRGFAGQSIALLRSASCLPFAGAPPLLVLGARLVCLVRCGALFLCCSARERRPKFVPRSALSIMASFVFVKGKQVLRTLDKNRMIVRKSYKTDSQTRLHVATLIH